MDAVSFGVLRNTLVIPALLFLTFATLVGCASDPALRVPAISPAPPSLTSSDLAQNFVRALETTDGLHVRERTFAKGRPATEAAAWMTRDSIRTDVYVDGERVYALSVRGVRAQELIPEGTVADGRRGPRFEDYTLEKVGQIGYPRLVSGGWCCYFGDLTGTWLGPNCALHEFMGDRIAGSKLLGVARVGDIDCAVVRWDEDDNDPADNSSPDQFRQGATYYLNLSRGWIVRSDSFQQEGRSRNDRIWLYQVESATPDPAVFELNSGGPDGR